MGFTPTAADRAREWIHTYTRDLSREDLQRLFTDDTRDAYDFFARGLDEEELAALPWWKRAMLRFRQVFVAFTLKLPAARRAVYFVALFVAVLGLLKLYQGFQPVSVPLGIPFVQVTLLLPVWAEGTFALIISLVLVNLLVLLEVAERLSLKGELEVAREIQLALLPKGTYSAHDTEISGFTKPANTVGGDFYDVLPQGDGKIVLTLGDVAGKGSPAALLMALLLAALRTLVEERLTPETLVARLNVQICRHSPASRFITLVYAAYDPLTGVLTYVNAGQNPPLLRRRDGRIERLSGTGIALGLFEQSTYCCAQTILEPGDVLTFYSDGITEAEDPNGQPLEESGLEQILERHASRSAIDIGAEVLSAVQAHARRAKFADDLTILVLKRAAA
ncbi:MAG TPA: PP2C family protein-serine/threonine phosphatase [Vicinamibacterales bacterium]|nr:PP2C family protein-serine/threonine phosphatase [Vicinamibacterales bacterium]